MNNYFSSNLIESCIYKNAEFFSELRVITGYSSASFIQSIISKYPKLKLEIYIGMAKQGISFEDHEKFQLMTISNSNIEIYYQITAPMNHIKLYQWNNFGENCKSFVGSANFSENGFKLQQELLMETEIDFNDFIASFYPHMMLCTNPEISKYIPFHEDSSKTQKEQEPIVEFDENIVGKIEIDEIIVLDTELKKEKNSAGFLELKRIAKEEKLEKLIVYLVHNKKISINEWILKQTFSDLSHILNQTTKQSKQNFFPKTSNFKVYTDDGEIFECHVTGNFNSHIMIVNHDKYNFYTYIKSRLGIREMRQLTVSDFENYGTMKLMFYKKSEMKYYMDFSPNNYLEEQ